MGTPLSHFATQLVRDEAALRRSVISPLLVWEAASGGGAPGTAASGEPWHTTGAGAASHVPSAVDPLVFPVRKGNSEKNAFALGITVGRTLNNDIALDDESVSRFHAYFQQDPREKVWKLADADSSNGTFVGSERLSAKGPAVLKDGDAVRFGSVQTRFFEPEGFFRYLRAAMESPAGPKR